MSEQDASRVTRTDTTVRLDHPDTWDVRAWWYDSNALGHSWAHGAVETADQSLRIISTEPVALRALAAALCAAADQAEKLYAEHGVDPS